MDYQHVFYNPDNDSVLVHSGRNGLIGINIYYFPQTILKATIKRHANSARSSANADEYMRDKSPANSISTFRFEDAHSL